MNTNLQVACFIIVRAGRGKYHIKVFKNFLTENEIAYDFTQSK